MAKRWSWLFGWAAAKAVAASRLEMQGCAGTDGTSPAGHEVEGDFRYAGSSNVAHVFLRRWFISFWPKNKQGRNGQFWSDSKMPRMRGLIEEFQKSTAMMKSVAIKSRSC